MDDQVKGQDETEALSGEAEGEERDETHAGVGGSAESEEAERGAGGSAAAEDSEPGAGGSAEAEDAEPGAGGSADAEDAEPGVGGSAEAEDAEPGVGEPAAPAEKLLATRDAIVGIFEKLGAHVQVEVRDTPEAIRCSVQILRGASVLDAGPRGQVLDAVQHLVNRIVNREGDGRKWISIELGDARSEANEPAMNAMAERLGGAMLRMGKTLTIVPMHSRDRRIVHTTLAEREGIRTRSEGEGPLRRLIVERVLDAGAEDT